MKLVRMPGFFRVNIMNNLYTMEFLTLILCVLPAIATSISISPNGNSPKVKMIGGMMVDVQKGFVPMTSKVETTTRSNYEKSRNVTNGINSTKLALNERYRRLIPYMTFYYANDLARPSTDSARNVEIEKAQIIEAKEIEHSIQRQPKKIFYSSQRNIPRFQGNRLTQYNIASANPTKIFYKDGVPIYQSPFKVFPNNNPFISDVSFNSDYDQGRLIPKQTVKPPGVAFLPTRKPFLNLYNEETPNIRYYIPEKEQAPKYKLVPYEQTPPVKVPQKETIYEVRKPVVVSTVYVPKDLHVKPRPIRPHVIYENTQHVRKQPSIISETYYEKQRPLAVEPVVESGFRPIVTPAEYTTESHIHTSAQPETLGLADIELEKRPPQLIEPVPEEPISNTKPNYYQYVAENPQYHPTKQTASSTVTLASLLNSLQVNKSIPKTITRENVASSIRTLLQVLNVLKSVEHPIEAEAPILSTPKPFIAPKVAIELNKLSNAIETHNPELSGPELNEEHYLAEVDIPSQHLDDHSNSGVTSQQFPLPVTSDDEGGTPGQPGIDYPILTVIPPTSFDCKTQRYKGFFADPETRCQVWHYCDLNGGQASFLCPNGTIFSQAGLTCDWWFNVRCASTTQLYVLNESLYKYILPHSPKFPEDYSGPLVDKYLTLKFKEMEEEFNKKKKSKQASDSSEDDSEEDENEESIEEESDISKEPSIKSQRNTVSEASVIVETPGDSGKVERLSDD